MNPAFLSFLTIILAVNAQTCLNSRGQSVAWWVIIKVPPKVGKLGYGYYDSTMKTSKFIYIDAKVDAGSTPLTQTQQQINSQSLEHVAWNDQKPTGEVSSTLAHSKGFIAFKSSTGKGFLINHSIPKYPGFSGAKIIPQISSSQNVYGQHLACFSLTLKELEDIASYMLITWPFVYQTTIVNSAATQNLYKLATSNFPRETNLFNKHDLRTVFGYTLKTIFKNNQVNGSIFEDGLTSYLAVAPIIAETWGRPIEKPWCRAGLQVLNAVNLNIGGVGWNEQDDHAKWVVASSLYGCFGDMNRMDSQWKRGGSFFCLTDSTLAAAVRSLIISHDSC